MGENSMERQSVTLTGPWGFQVDAGDVGLREGWFGPKYNRKKWGKAAVPGAWDCYDDALWGYEGVGWFTTTVTPPPSPPGGRTRLLFARVMYHATVWVNGERLGDHANGYLPFGFDVTPCLRRRAPLTVVVRVDNRPRSEWLPAAPVIEWVQYGGILGPVRLVALPAVHIADCSLHAVPDRDGGLLTAVVDVGNSGATSFAGSLRFSVALGSKRIVQEAGVACPANGTVSVPLSLKLPGAKLWSPESPVLYGCTAALRSAEAAVDEAHSRFGVRSVTVAAERVLLNGAPLRIKGVNRYDEYGRLGPTPPASLVRRDLGLLKQTGVNCIRVHYPQSSEFLSMCDEMGFLVMEEVPLNWWGNNWWKDKPAPQSMEILGPARAALEGMVRRDRNHPCVFAWSMANESATHTEIGAAVMRDLMKRCRELDPTRPVCFVVACDVRHHAAAAEADLICTNIYYGLHNGEAAHRTDQIEALVYEPSRRHLEEHAAAFPGKPVVVTEFGMRGILGLRGDVDYTEDFQAAYIDAVLRAMHAVPQVAGGMLWSWADYWHRRDLIHYAPFGPYGVVTVDRRPKLALKTLAEWYRGRAHGILSRRNSALGNRDASQSRRTSLP
jgi:beta-glucuronidase